MRIFYDVTSVINDVDDVIDGSNSNFLKVTPSYNRSNKKNIIPIKFH